MKKWYNEEYEFEIEVTGFLRGDHTEHYCRNGEEVGDQYTCTYGCPVNKDGQGICSKTMMMLYPLMEAVRSGGDLENLGGSSRCHSFRCISTSLKFLSRLQCASFFFSSSRKSYGALFSASVLRSIIESSFS